MYMKLWWGQVKHRQTPDPHVIRPHLWTTDQTEATLLSTLRMSVSLTKHVWVSGLCLPSPLPALPICTLDKLLWSQFLLSRYLLGLDVQSKAPWIDTSKHPGPPLTLSLHQTAISTQLCLFPHSSGLEKQLLSLKQTVGLWLSKHERSENENHVGVKSWAE